MAADQITLSRQYPTQPLVAVGAVVFKAADLLLVRRKAEPRADTWTLPGGLVELGESCRGAVVREVREECGIEIEVVKLIDVVDFIDRDPAGRVRFHYVLVDFEARYVSGELQPSAEIRAARWCKPTDLADLVIADVTRLFLEKHYPS